MKGQLCGQVVRFGGKICVALCRQILLVKRPSQYGVTPGKGFLQHHQILSVSPIGHKRLLAGITGIVAPRWHIETQNKTQQGHKDRTVSQPALARISFYLAKASSVKNQNGPASHLSLANALLSWGPFLSDWLKIKNSPQLAGEWIRQVFISLPFPFHRNICVHNFRIVIWALREGHRGLFVGPQRVVEESWLQRPPGRRWAGGLLHPENRLAPHQVLPELAPDKPTCKVLETGVLRAEPKSLCHQKLTVESQKKMSYRQSILLCPMQDEQP